VNPTSSFKDRGVAFLVSKMVEEGARTVVIDSSGNAAVSTAAYEIEERFTPDAVFVPTGSGSGLKSNLMLDEFSERITPIENESELERFIEEAR